MNTEHKFLVTIFINPVINVSEGLRYNIPTTHVSGKDNLVADVLSRASL